MRFLKTYWLYLLILVVAVLFLFRTIRITLENSQLAKYGKITYAVIGEREWESASYKTEDGFYYSFIINETLYEGHTFDQEKMPSDSIMIVYLPSNPFINRPFDFIKRNYSK